MLPTNVRPMRNSIRAQLALSLLLLVTPVWAHEVTLLPHNDDLLISVLGGDHLTSSTVPFGNLLLSSEAESTVTVTNTSSRPVTVAPQATAELTVSQSTMTLAPGGSESFQLTWTATFPGPAPGSLSLEATHDGIANPRVELIALTGAAVDPAELLPSSVNFGEVFSGSVQVEATNSTQWPATVAVQTPLPAGISVSPSQRLVPAGATVSFTLARAATGSSATFTGSIDFESTFDGVTGSRVETVTYEGTEVSPPRTVPYSVSLGEILVSNPYSVQFAATNTSQWPVTLEVQPPLGAGISIAPSQQLIPPGSSSSFTLTRAATSSPGYFSGSFGFESTFAGVAGSRIETMSYAGNVVQPAALQASEVDFGEVIPGATNTLLMTVTNPSSYDATLQASSAQQAGLTLSPTGSVQVLAGGSSIFEVSYTADDSAGSFSGSMSLDVAYSGVSGAALDSLPFSWTMGTLVEFSQPTPVAPGTWNTLYNPTGIQIGNNLFLYRQGDDENVLNDTALPECGGAEGDQIIAYRAPIVNGEPGNFVRVGRVSPKAYSPTRGSYWDQFPNCTNPPAAFGPGQVFKAKTNGVTKYHLIADVSDVFLFKNVWRAESTDGINWTWFTSGPNTSGTESLIRSDTGGTYQIARQQQSQAFVSTSIGNGFALLNAVVLPRDETSNNSEWWGYLNMYPPRVVAARFNWASGSPQLELVNKNGASYSESDFVSITYNRITSSPKTTLSNIIAKTLRRDPGVLAPGKLGYKLWGHGLHGTCGVGVNCNTNLQATCNSSGGCTTADGTTLQNGESGRPFWLMVKPQGDILPCKDSFERSGIESYSATPTANWSASLLISNSRELPTGYSTGANSPFVWESPGGTTYMFSATNDANVCDKLLFSPFWLQYTAQSILKRFKLDPQ